MYELSRNVQDPVHEFFGIWLYDVHDRMLWKKRLFNLKMSLERNTLGM